jgi:uncharacterized membrane-anchored protein
MRLACAAALGVAAVGLCSLVASRAWASSTTWEKEAAVHPPVTQPGTASAKPEPAPRAIPPPLATEGEQPQWQKGPLAVELSHELELQLPEHYVFLGMPDADRVMRNVGNLENANLLGIVVSDREDSRWFISVRYSEDGHVDDRDAIDGDALLEQIRDGTEQGNGEREQRGFPPAHVESWNEAPRYERAVHHLVWAFTLKSMGGDSLNYNTRILGRRGVVSLNLVTPPEELARDRAHAMVIAKATRFKKGARYEDFDRTKDRVAEYGLVGLVLGGAGFGAVKLAKVGLLAKFWKVIAAAAVALWAGLKRMFRGKAEVAPK